MGEKGSGVGWGGVGGDSCSGEAMGRIGGVFKFRLGLGRKGGDTNFGGGRAAFFWRFLFSFLLK